MLPIQPTIPSTILPTYHSYAHLTMLITHLTSLTTDAQPGYPLHAISVVTSFIPCHWSMIHTLQSPFLSNIYCYLTCTCYCLHYSLILLYTITVINIDMLWQPTLPASCYCFQLQHPMVTTCSTNGQPLVTHGHTCLSMGISSILGNLWSTISCYLWSLVS